MTVASAGELTTARYLIAEELRDSGVSPADLQAILLATHEAAKNGLGFSEGAVQICMLEHEQQVEVSVTDPGKGFDYEAVHCAIDSDREAPAGRGLRLMKALIDEVRVETLPHGCLVWMAKRLSSRSSIAIT